jgi:hypothetical protein
MNVGFNRQTKRKPSVFRLRVVVGYSAARTVASETTLDVCQPTELTFGPAILVLAAIAVKQF